MKKTISFAIAVLVALSVSAQETEEQKEYLTKRGCNVIQGYYYSRPLTFDEYKKALESEDN